MKRLSLLSIGLYLFLIVAFFALSGELVALAIPPAVYILAALLQSPEELRLQVTRTLNTTCVSQELPVEVTIVIQNLGSHLAEILVSDMLPEGLSLVEGETQLGGRLPAGETLTLRYVVKGLRGTYEFRNIHVVATEPLGLFRRRARLEAPEVLLVLPEVLRLRRVPIRPLQTRGYAGPIPARAGGSGVDFFGVREYQPGDPQRWINWRISARHSRSLFTNEFEQERVADVGLILDARRRNDYRVNGESLFEYSVRATAALAGVFLNDGNRVTLLVYGRGLEWTFPGYGKVQREQILRGLARAKTGDSLVFESLDYLPTRLFAAKSQLVLISPLCEEDPQMLSRLRSRGYQMLVVSPDPVRFESRTLADQELGKVAVRLAQLERALLLRKLRNAGIPVVDWDVNQAFEQTVYAAIGRTPLWFRAVEVSS
ncbi:MAG TPA: DUF58 domain-containing protein [Anaerolineae bacterium]|nr:DUF58 domain-containing protein [Anaerolineae bacterium]